MLKVRIIAQIMKNKEFLARITAKKDENRNVKTSNLQVLVRQILRPTSFSTTVLLKCVLFEYMIKKLV